MKETIIQYIRAGYPGLAIISAEETRVEAALKSIAQELNSRLFAWSLTDGMLDVQDGNVQDAPDPVAALGLIADQSSGAIILLRDFHLHLDQPDLFLVRALKDTLGQAKAKGNTLILLGCRYQLPPELAREIVRIDFDLPNLNELELVLDQVALSAGSEIPSSKEKQRILDAASGLTCLEAENAFALAIVGSGKLDAECIASEKAKTIAQSGLLEICATPASLDNVGGLDLLKDWLRQRKHAFSKGAKAYGLPNPKGLLILGIPGTGKSLSAKATAKVFERPLLKLDTGRLFAGLVGQSEANLRSVIATAEAMAPCVLWIDEIEKGFQRSSGTGDGGTSSRVMGTFLTWMQDKTKPVFVVATANDVLQLPPEFLRKGRFDDIFHVDLPNETERMAIWRIQIAKYGRDPENFDLESLVVQSEGMTGAEIEQAVIDALYTAFARKKEPNTEDILNVLKEQVPLGTLMKEEITRLQRWAQGRARSASSSQKNEPILADTFATN